jgi:hypothetical protein
MEPKLVEVAALAVSHRLRNVDDRHSAQSASGIRVQLEGEWSKFLDVSRNLGLVQHCQAKTSLRSRSPSLLIEDSRFRGKKESDFAREIESYQTDGISVLTRSGPREGVIEVPVVSANSHV